MNQIAVKATLSDYPWMPRRAKSTYVPPKDTGTISLSQALLGTERVPDARQLNFLGKAKNIGDQKIFYAGDLSLLKCPCPSLARGRYPTRGAAATEWLARKLSDAGIVVVSGLAYGVDTVAHTAALAQGGKTIAVLGTPLDKASPSENSDLQESIYREHLLISQFSSGEKTHRSNFPLRNRLMATISDATVVMEASDASPQANFRW
jgi:DNA processing protein